MPMAVMDVRVMRVRMCQFFVAVGVRVRFASRVAGCVGVLMMLVVSVQMIRS